MAECSGLGSRLRDIEASIVSGGGGSVSGDPCSAITFNTLTTTTTSFVVAATIPILPNSVVYIDLDAIARQTDGAGRAAFKRIGLFYRNGGAVLTDELWHSIFTQESDKLFNVDYVLLASSIQLRVKAASAVATNWQVCVHVSRVS